MYHMSFHTGLVLVLCAKKVTERIMNKLWSDTKLSVFGPLFQVDLQNDPIMDEICIGAVFL